MKNDRLSEIFFFLFIFFFFYVNIGFYILSLFFFPVSLNLLNPLYALAPSIKSIVLLGATGTYPIDKMGRWWTLVSANYLHGSLLHIVFNMFAVKYLGMITGHLYGRKRMFIIYTISGIISSFASYIMGVKFSIGASGCICGLVGAALYYGKSRGAMFKDVVFRQVRGWLIGLFIIGFMPNINNWGHLGGIIAGIITGFLLEYQEKRKDGLSDRILYGISLILTLFALAWAIISAILLRI